MRDSYDRRDRRRDDRGDRYDSHRNRDSYRDSRRDAPRDSYSQRDGSRDGHRGGSTRDDPPRGAYQSSHAPRDSYSKAPRDSYQSSHPPSESYQSSQAPRDSYQGSRAPRDSYQSSGAPRQIPREASGGQDFSNPGGSDGTTGEWDGKKEAEEDPTWARIYISNLPSDTTSDEVQELFGGIGVIAKEKQKRGYKDQWPYKIKLYTETDGSLKGDGVVTFEDPNAARSAPSFFNGHELRGSKLKVELAGKPEPPKGGWTIPASRGGRGGRGGRGRYRPY